jgi:hypothetical protein
VHLKFPRFENFKQMAIKEMEESCHTEKTNGEAVYTSLRINLSKHQNASASSLRSTIMGEHKSLIPITMRNGKKRLM